MRPLHLLALLRCLLSSHRVDLESNVLGSAFMKSSVGGLEMFGLRKSSCLATTDSGTLVVMEEIDWSFLFLASNANEQAALRLHSSGERQTER